MPLCYRSRHVHDVDVDVDFNTLPFWGLSSLLFSPASSSLLLNPVLLLRLSASQREVDQEFPQVSAAALRRAARMHSAGRDPDQYGEWKGRQEKATQEQPRRGK